MAYLQAIDLGTKKKCARTTITGTWNNAGTDNVDLSTYVPKGVRAVELMIGVTDATPGTGLGIRRTGGSVSEAAVYAQVNGISNYIVCDALLDSNLTFDLYKAAAFDVVSLFLTAYYL